MLYLPPGVGVPVRVHGAFVGDDEVHRVVNDWKSRAEPEYIDDIVSSAQETGPIPGWSGTESSSSEDSDDLYDEAVNFVLESEGHLYLQFKESLELVITEQLDS